jgi:REP element-mobilizing transposase RayT
VENGKMFENKYGAIVREEWNQTAIVRPYILLDAFTIMPDHIHGIIRLTDRRGTARRAPITIEQFGKPTTACRAPTIDNTNMAYRGDDVDNITDATCRGDGCDRVHWYTARRVPTIEQFGKPTTDTIPTIVRALKSAVSKRIHLLNQTFKWQRNYYEHVIRDEKSLFLIRKYILENPMRWPDDAKNHITREIRQFDMGNILCRYTARRVPTIEKKS